MDQFPRSLKALKEITRKEGFHDTFNLRTVWAVLEPFFLSRGLTLWNHLPESRSQLTPPDARARAPDGFSYRWPDDMDKVHDFCQSSPFICPARTRDGRDVVIRLISIGQDGIHHRMALERLATGNIASVIGNHTIPVLQWLTLEDLFFAVFPFLSMFDPTTDYLYEDTRDLVQHFYQMIEAVEFCHSRLVAHRDIFEGNFLCNFYGAADLDTSFDPPSPGRRVRPLRSLFPFMVYLIDFERAACFDLDSDPSTHLVWGRPQPYNTPDDPDAWKYNVPPAPEMDKPEPHNPFRADIWQLGTYFSHISETNNMPAPLLDLIKRMTSSLPEERPIAGDVLASMREMISQLSLEDLRAPVWISAAPSSSPV